MQLTSQDADRLAREGIAALQAGRAAEARSRFDQVTGAGFQNVEIWMLTATACRQLNDAEAEEAALDRLLAAPAESLVMNCGYGRGFSVLEVLDCVDRVTNLKVERRMMPRRAGDPPALIADNQRILATLPWRPARDSLDLIVADALAWERRLAERPPTA